MTKLNDQDFTPSLIYFCINIHLIMRFISFIFQDDVGGLEIQTSGGECVSLACLRF